MIQRFVDGSQAAGDCLRRFTKLVVTAAAIFVILGSVAGRAEEAVAISATNAALTASSEATEAAAVDPAAAEPATASPAASPAQATTDKPRLDIYGFAMLDTGYNAGAIHPDWSDTVRPTKLPSFKNEFGKDGNWFAGVRQSRLGFKAFIPTDMGEIKTIFEFELFGTGVDAGQTTFRLRHAWGEWRWIGAGQTWSPFMDPDVFPNSVEYWGPNGMVFYRNVQVRFTPWSSGDSNFMIALERPGASADGGTYADRIELQSVKARFPAPDISAHFRYAKDWGHIQVGTIFREMKWDDLNPQQTDLSGDATGWGVNLSSNLKLAKHVLRLQLVYGNGIENYMNDAPADVGAETNFNNPSKPLEGKALPVLGAVSFLDLNWNEKWTSTIGYSRLDINTSNAQSASAFKSGQYALGNILYYPVKGMFVGPEFQWGYRDNNKDHWHYADYRVQVSFKYNFSFSIGG